jgi:hypothetical protein
MKERNPRVDFPTRESRYVEFKERLDVARAEEWCELIKDLVAIANSGGGDIFVGIANNGVSSGWDPSPLLNFDPAQVVDKIAKYTGEQFSGFAMSTLQRGSSTICRISVDRAEYPLVFVNPGTYEVAPGKQKTAFGRGTVYFRHGAKSEPCTHRDLRSFLDQRVEQVRRSWMGNIRKVVQAPHGYQVHILSPEIQGSQAGAATPVRVVDDLRAPVYGRLNPDVSHPHRQKDVVVRINQMLSGKRAISPFDIQCIRRIHKVDGTKPEWFYKSRFASPQYSDAFVAWVVQEYQRDESFFDTTRLKYREQI